MEMSRGPPVAWQLAWRACPRPPHQAIDGQKDVDFRLILPRCPSSNARRHGVKLNYTNRPCKTQMTGRQYAVLSLGQG